MWYKCTYLSDGEIQGLSAQLDGKDLDEHKCTHTQRVRNNIIKYMFRWINNKLVI